MVEYKALDMTTLGKDSKFYKRKPKEPQALRGGKGRLSDHGTGHGGSQTGDKISIDSFFS